MLKKPILPVLALLVVVALLVQGLILFATAHAHRNPAVSLRASTPTPVLEQPRKA